MGFFHAQALKWLLLAGLIAAFYIVRFSRRRRNVSSMMLWERTFSRRPPRRRWQRPVSVLVQVVILAMLVLTYAEPFWSATWMTRRSIVVIVDTSASMNASDVETSRLWQARLQAKRLIDDLGPYDQLAIVSAGGLVQVHATLTGDRPTLQRALDEIRPTDGGNRVSEAVTLARKILRAKTNSQVVLLSDGCFDGPAELFSSESVLVCATRSNDPQPTAVANVGVTRVAARSSSDDARVQEVFVEFFNAGETIAKCPFRLEPADVTGVNEVIEMSPGRPTRRVFSVASELPRLLTAVLDTDDQLLADNQASLLLSGRKPLVIQVAGASAASARDAAFQRLMAALRSVPGTTVVTDTDDGTADISVFLYEVSGNLPVGPVLAIAPEGDCDLWARKSEFEGSAQIAWNPGFDRLPIVSNLPGFTDIVIDALIEVDYREEPTHVVPASVPAPVASLWDRAEGRVLLLHVPLGKTDFCLHDSFPTFIGKAIDWLATREKSFRRGTTTRDVVRLLEDRQARSELTTPFGQSRYIAANQDLIGPLTQVGIWSVGQPRETSSGSAEIGTADSFVIPANLLDRRETDLRPRSDLNYSAPPITGRNSQNRLWMTFAAILVALILVEWLLFQRGILI